MKYITKSSFYKPLIIISTILAIFSICYLFYIVIVKYLIYKNENIAKEAFYDGSSNVGIVSMMKSPKNVDVWLTKHRNLGIQHFYIRLEETPELEEYLSQQPDVTLQIGKSEGLNEYDVQQERQNTWVNECLRTAETDGHGLNWLFHIDGDEILRGDLSELNSYPEDVRTIWIQNEEAKFTKVPGKEDSCFEASKMANCGEDGGCVSYGNGKSCGRVTSDVQAHGPHRMKSTLETSSLKNPNIVVEHYESCDFEIYKEKFKRLSVQDRNIDIPFSYYNESIEAAKKDDDDELYRIYEKYRVIQ